MAFRRQIHTLRHAAGVIVSVALLGCLASAARAEEELAADADGIDDSLTMAHLADAAAHPAAPVAPARPMIRVARAANLVGAAVGPQLAPGSAGAMLGEIPSQLPFSLRLLSSGFGSRTHPILGGVRTHAGLDFAAPYGSAVAATAAGRVAVAGWSGSYGNLVVIDHGGGVETRYAHLSRISVAKGQQIESGQEVGRVGSTGRSTGPHLHYEVRVEGRAINPGAHS